MTFDKSQARSLLAGGALFCFALAVAFLVQATTTHAQTIWSQNDWLAVLVFVVLGFGLLIVRKVYANE